MAERGFLQIDGEDLDELIADLRGVEKSLGREQRKANRGVAQKVAAWAQSAARTGTPAQRRFAGAIAAGATQNTARLRLNSRGRNAGAGPTFFGASRRTGWYAAPKFDSAPAPQFPRHVGTGWVAGGPGGPYVLNPTIRNHRPEIEDLYLDAYERAFNAAIPKG